MNLISGRWAGVAGPIETLTGVFMATIDLAAGGRVRFEQLGGRNAFFYVVRGRLRLGDDEAAEHMLLELGPDGDTLEVEALADTFFVLGHASPFHFFARATSSASSLPLL